MLAISRMLMHPMAKVVVAMVALAPFMWLVWGALRGTLGANPAEALIRSTGDWTLRFLCLTLAVTPARVIANLPPLARMRRMLGLFVYFYAALHLLAYSWFDMGFELSDIGRDIVKRPFILVLTPLAATSFNSAVRALGARRWQALHKAVYLIAVLAVLHFFWMRAGKNNFGEVAVYGAILAGLLGWRVAWYVKKKRL
jgi:sulfoxide reductase heme-binding subunit YedZ